MLTRLVAVAQRAALTFFLATPTALALVAVGALGGLAVRALHQKLLKGLVTHVGAQSRIQREVNPDHRPGIAEGEANLLEDVICEPAALQVDMVQVLVVLDEFAEVIRDEELLLEDCLALFLDLNQLELLGR